MWEVEVSPSVLDYADGLYDFGALRNSIMSGRSNRFGAIGESVFAAHYPDWEHSPSRDYDFVHHQFGSVDIKTKRTTTTPRPWWNCSVAATSMHQRCDFYFFVRVSERLDWAWLLGWVTADELRSRGRFGRAGEPDGDGWLFRADCWNVRVDELHPPTRPVC